MTPNKANDTQQNAASETGAAENAQQLGTVSGSVDASEENTSNTPKQLEEELASPAPRTLTPGDRIQLSKLIEAANALLVSETATFDLAAKQQLIETRDLAHVILGTKQ